MKIHETENQLISRQRPLAKWFWGTLFLLLFAGFGVFLFISAWNDPQLFLGSPEKGIYDRILSIIVSLMMVGFLIGMIGLFLSMIATPVVTTTVDRTLGTLFINRRGLFSTGGERYLISDLKRFEIERVQGDGVSMFVAARLKNDKFVRLEMDPGPDPDEIIGQLNRFLGK